MCRVFGVSLAVIGESKVGLPVCGVFVCELGSDW